jgi:hypothetical protein
LSKGGQNRGNNQETTHRKPILFNFASLHR